MKVQHVKPISISLFEVVLVFLPALVLALLSFRLAFLFLAGGLGFLLIRQLSIHKVLVILGIVLIACSLAIALYIAKQRYFASFPPYSGGFDGDPFNIAWAWRDGRWVPAEEIKSPYIADPLLPNVKLLAYTIDIEPFEFQPFDDHLDIFTISQRIRLSSLNPAEYQSEANVGVFDQGLCVRVVHIPPADMIMFDNELKLSANLAYSVHSVADLCDGRCPHPIVTLQRIPKGIFFSPTAWNEEPKKHLFRESRRDYETITWQNPHLRDGVEFTFASPLFGCSLIRSVIPNIDRLLTSQTFDQWLYALAGLALPPIAGLLQDIFVGLVGAIWGYLISRILSS